MSIDFESATSTSGRAVDTSALRLIRPVLLCALANGILFAAIDHSQLWSVASAAMATILLGAVLTRQLGLILGLQKQVASGARQLTVVSEVVSTLNASTNVGSTLGAAFEKLVSGLDADAGAIWLASATPDRMLVLAQHQGLPSAHRERELLEEIRRVTAIATRPLIPHAAKIPGRPADNESAYCLTYRLGDDDDPLGFVTVMRWERPFDGMDGTILSAIGSDLVGCLRSGKLITEAQRQAELDPVTQLYNSRSAFQRLHGELTRHAGNWKPLAVIMADLDGFKLVNDTYGHAAGDEVLKRIAAVMRRACRDADVIARYGGDEFLMILPETGLKQAVRCAERIQSAIEREEFRYGDSDCIPIGCSYGIAVYPDDTKEAHDLISIADRNLYQAKAEGGNRIVARGGTSIETTLSHLTGFDLFWAMVVAVDNKDGYTRRHSESVTDIAVRLGTAMNMDNQQLETLRIAGTLHDLGKIGVPDSVLRKPGKLTPEEARVMQQHPVFGALIVGALPEMDDVVLGVRHHHERFDGRGYPDGRAGEDIPLIARIIGVADAFSAMTTCRPYRKALSEAEALSQIREGLGTQFDPELGRLFLELYEAHHSEVAVSQEPIESEAGRERYSLVETPR